MFGNRSAKSYHFFSPSFSSSTTAAVDLVIVCSARTKLLQNEVVEHLGPNIGESAKEKVRTVSLLVIGQPGHPRSSHLFSSSMAIAVDLVIAYSARTQPEL